MYIPTGLGVKWLSVLPLDKCKLFKNNIEVFNNKEVKHSMQNRKLWKIYSLGIVELCQKDNEKFYILNPKFFIWEQ